MDKKLNLLNELSSGEDEFDVDLMACGCRVAPAGLSDRMTMGQWVRHHGFSTNQLANLVSSVVTRTSYRGAARRDVQAYSAMGEEELAQMLDQITLETNYSEADLQKLAEEVKKG